MSGTKHWVLGFLISAAVLISVACGTAISSPLSPTLTRTVTPSPTTFITQDDIEPDEPSKKLKRFQPLADYLAVNLAYLGIDQGRVLLARDIEEMSELLKNGNVDVYLDSSFPTLAVQALSDSRIIARRWKSGDPTYWSTYITSIDSGITGPDGFPGKVLAFEEPLSTSGFVLPAGTLIQRGYHLVEVPGSAALVQPDKIGYLFARDEENLVEMARQQVVAGGAVSNQDYSELPEAIMAQLHSFEQTITVPRQLVSVRGDLDHELEARVLDLLVGLEQTEQGLAILGSLKKTKKFDAVPSESVEALTQLEVLIEIVSQG